MINSPKKPWYSVAAAARCTAKLSPSADDDEDDNDDEKDDDEDDDEDDTGRTLRRLLLRPSGSSSAAGALPGGYMYMYIYLSLFHLSSLNTPFKLTTMQYIYMHLHYLVGGQRQSRHHHTVSDPLRDSLPVSQRRTRHSKARSFPKP